MLSPLRAVVDITMTEKSSLIPPCEDMKLFILSISFQSLQYPSNSLELTHPFIQIPTGWIISIQSLQSYPYHLSARRFFFLQTPLQIYHFRHCVQVSGVM
jgi:hypothetical protein